ncbi:MAG: type II toxin-antitoxin system RelE/ParE family toxin [Acidimicrobiia bacterium]
MRPELVFEEDADRYLQQLEGDLNQVALMRAIHSRLNFLEDHPGSHSNRPLGYRGGQWRIDVEDHMIIWEMRDDLIVVRYIGPQL